MEGVVLTGERRGGGGRGRMVGIGFENHSAVHVYRVQTSTVAFFVDS